MLHKKHRLAKTSDVQKALGRGRAFFNPLFSLRFLSHSLQKRFTVVVSTKVSKKAVRRNRVKRLLREFIRLQINNFSFGDYVVMVKPAAGKLEDKGLLFSFEEFIFKTKLLKNEEDL